MPKRSLAAANLACCYGYALGRMSRNLKDLGAKVAGTFEARLRTLPSPPSFFRATYFGTSSSVPKIDTLRSTLPVITRGI
jgi:hypothetical protein